MRHGAMSGPLWLLVALAAAGAPLADLAGLAEDACPSGCELCIPEDVRRYYCGGQQLKIMVDRTGSYAEVDCNDAAMNCSRVPRVGARGALQRLEVTACALPPSLPLACAARGEGSEALTLRDGLSAPTAENVRALDAAEVFLSFRPGAVREFPLAALLALPRLRSARVLGGTDLSLWEDMFLPRPPPLTYLEVSMSGVEEVPGGAFRGLEGLATLSLWGNRIRALARGALDGLSSLERLVLNNNPLVELEARALGRARSLRALHLERVQLSALEEGALEGLPHLEQIRIVSTVELTLGPRAFSSLAALRDLYVVASGVTSLPVDLFRGTPGIVNLTLSNNKLAEVEPGAVAGLAALERLDLSGNRLRTLGPELLHPLTSLTSLLLDRNRLRELPAYTFSRLVRLRRVSAAHNELAAVSPVSFSGARALRHLSLSHNRLAWAEGAGLDDSSPFNMLHDLETLDLSHNEIGVIYSDWRIILARLRTLDLSYNNLTQLSRADVQFVFAPAVDVSHNRISSVQGRAPWEERSSSSVTLRIGDNPFLCDCNLYYFLDQLASSPEFELEGAACAAPRGLRGRALRALPLQEVSCPLEGAPAHCSCLIRPRLDAAECACDHTQQVPSIAESGVSRLSLRLTAPPPPGPGLLALPPHVTALNLSRLGLADVPPFPPTVRLLDLTGNGIRTLPAAVWEKYNDTTFRLVDNPLVCECSTAEEVLLLQTGSRRLRDFPDTTCADGTPLKAKDANALCDVFKSAVTGGLIAFLLIFLALLLALGYRHRVLVQVFLYSRGWCLSLLPRESLDADKKYDVFVSFAVEDERFVREELLPRLEGEYVLHVRDRDWEAGSTIPGELHRSVEESRRTLIVVSPGFLRSMWAMEQFRAVHAQAASDKRLRAVAVLLRLRRRSLDRETGTLLSLATLLRYDEPMFWEKLRFALPRGGARPAGGELARFWKGGGLDVVLNEEGKLVNKGYVKEV